MDVGVDLSVGFWRRTVVSALGRIGEDWLVVCLTVDILGSMFGRVGGCGGSFVDRGTCYAKDSVKSSGAFQSVR